MRIEFLGEGDLLSKMEELVADSIEISIASAFLSLSGLSILEKYLKKYDQIKSIQILLDENFHPDADNKIRLLNQMMALPNTEVRLFCDDRKLFHAKMYFFTGEENLKVVVGSSNLTGGGLLHNVEMNTLFLSDTNNSEITQLKQIYKEFWDRGLSAKEFLNKQGGSMVNKDFKIGDKVSISNKLELGIGKIVDISDKQVDIYFKETGVAETAHINDVLFALDPFDMAKRGSFDDATKFEIRTMALLLPIVNKNGILSNAIIEILPHQILAAHKVITSNARRLLLADEVGLGKTYEAGIIIKELISRGEAERVLIITPASLVYQWQDDMKNFGLNFTIYQSGFETSIIDFWNSVNLVITSIDTIKVEDNLKGVVDSKNWDVIIFDEAHHLTRKDYGDKADKSDRYRVGEQLRDKTEALLFLTATPHQGDRNKFYNLIDLLDSNLFKDETDLLYNRAKLGQIMIRQRKIDVTDDEGKPIFVRRIVTALKYTLSKDEKRFFEELNRYLLTGYKAAEQNAGKEYRALGFVMVTFQKIAASSISAIKTALTERLIHLLFIEAEKCSDITYENIRTEIVFYAKSKHKPGTNDSDIFSSEKKSFDDWVREEGIDPLAFMATPDEISSLKTLLSVAPKNEDTKLAELIVNIRAMKSQNPDEKFIIFTEYLATQDYIVNKLREVYDDADVVYIRGGDHQEKINAAKAFRKSAHFLVSTQAGGEGINLQHCHILINYDMPWNPMKVEQRIGRVHRYKQKDTVQIYNMFARDTIEDRIYERLENKLVEISQTIGNDDEKEAFRENILGIVAEELNFDELYKDVLKKGQNEDYITQEKIDDAIKRAKEIYEKLGDFTQELEKFNLETYFKTKGKFSLEDVEAFVIKFVQSENKRISTDEDGNYEFIVPDIIRSYGGRKETRITFDRSKAIEDPSLQFMAIGHPITDSIITKCSGYGYGGRCVKRQISDSQHKGEAGVQLNYTVEYQIALPGQGKNKILQKDLIVLIFDKDNNYRQDLELLGFIESEKKVGDKEFSFLNEQYLHRVEEEARKTLQEIIQKNIEILQQQFSNVIYKHNLESLAFFTVR